MIVTCVHIEVKEAYLAAFKEATIANHKGTRQEPGNLRFDVLQAHDKPTKFVLYEVFENEEAIAFHKQTSHYLTWRETVADMMAAQRYGVRYEPIEPTDKTLW
ncbi:MAG: antibiotic biosynthesis monooxygenase [Bacteroidota bacterium]